MRPINIVDNRRNSTSRRHDVYIHGREAAFSMIIHISTKEGVGNRSSFTTIGRSETRRPNKLRATPKETSTPRSVRLDSPGKRLREPLTKVGGRSLITDRNEGSTRNKGIVLPRN